MSGKKNLSKARGLNSIADPSEFRGRSGRKPKETPDIPTESPVKPTSDPEAPQKTPESVENNRPGAAPEDAASTPPPSPSASPVDAGHDASAGQSSTTTTPAPAKRRGRPPITGNRRIRRELSVPVAVADAVEQTGINPADLVMNAYRRHSDGVFTGSGARMAARGRKRLRISLSDGDFDKITRLGEARNWNRSETVSVLLSLDLLPTDAVLGGSAMTGPGN